MCYTELREDPSLVERVTSNSFIKLVFFKYSFFMQREVLECLCVPCLYGVYIIIVNYSCITTNLVPLSLHL